MNYIINFFILKLKTGLGGFPRLCLRGNRNDCGALTLPQSTCFRTEQILENLGCSKIGKIWCFVDMLSSNLCRY